MAFRGQSEWYQIMVWIQSVARVGSEYNQSSVRVQSEFTQSVFSKWVQGISTQHDSTQVQSEFIQSSFRVYSENGLGSEFTQSSLRVHSEFTQSLLRVYPENGFRVTQNTDEDIKPQSYHWGMNAAHCLAWCWRIQYIEGTSVQFSVQFQGLCS